MNTGTDSRSRGGAMTETLDPPASTGRLLGRYAVLAGATIGGQLISMVVLAIVARKLGPSYLGAYSWAANVATYFALPLMPGIAVLAIRDLASRRGDEREVMSEAQGLLIVNGVIAYGALVAFTGVLTDDPARAALLPIAGLSLIANAVGFDWVLQGLQRAKALAAWRLGGQIAFGVVAPLVVAGGLAGARAYTWCNILAYTITGIGSMVWVWRSHGHTLRALSAGAALRRVRRSLPFGASLVMIQIYLSLDFVLLGYLVSNAAVGEYTAAAKIPIALNGLSTVWIAILYPHAAALFQADREQLRRQVNQLTSIALLVAIPMIPAGFIVGGPLIRALFGDTFSGAATPFAVLMCSAAVVIVNSNIGNLLLACGDEKRFFVAVLVGAIVNLALNLILIPPHGPLGSAIATLAAEGSVLALMTARFQRVVGRITPEWRRLASGIAGAAAMSLALLALPESAKTWWLEIALGGLVYASVVVLTRGVTFAEVAALGRQR
jgi:O-antigen/teichoic acid export membrane protein